MKIIAVCIALAMLAGPAWGRVASVVCMTASGGRIVIIVIPGTRTASVMLSDGRQSFGSYLYWQASGTIVQTDAVRIAIQDDGQGAIYVGTDPGASLFCPAFSPIR